MSLSFVICPFQRALGEFIVSVSRLCNWNMAPESILVSVKVSNLNI